MALIEWILRLLKRPAPAPVVTPPPMPTPPPPAPLSRREELYLFAKSCLGRKMGLNKAVPQTLNCANALSHVLISFGVKGLPPKGLEGTPALDAWLGVSEEFEEVSQPMFGDIASFPTGSGNGKIRGHIFIVGKNDWMSNNSNTGKWDAHWKKEKVLDYYVRYGGLKPGYFRLKD